MNKTLLALAVLAVATGAQAESSVSLYGIADLSLKNEVTKASDGSKKESSSVATDGLQASRIGFKGERDVATGLKANFVLEYGVLPNDNSGTGIKEVRTGTVGLAGNFGAATVGRRNTLIKDIEYSLNANAGETATAGYLGDNARETRRSNVVTYTTPAFSGFSADLQLGLGGNTKTTNPAGVVTADGKSQDSSSIGLNYANGPLTVKFGHETVKEYGKSISVAGYSIGTTGTATSDRKNDVLGASYDLGLAKLYFNATRAKQGADATSVTFDSNNFGVRVPYGAFTFNAGYSDGKAQLAGQPEKADMRGLQLSAWYDLTKDVTLYAIYGKEEIKHPTFTSKPTQSDVFAGVRYKF